VLNVAFCLSLVPMMRHSASPPPLAASLSTGLLLATGSVTLATLGLWGTAVCQGVVACQWLCLAHRRMHRHVPTD
jgi:hypothetical protein